MRMSHISYTKMRNHRLIIAAIRPFSIEDQSSRLIYTKSNKPEKRHRMHKVISEQGLSLNQIRSTVGSSQLHKQRFKVSKCSNETFAISRVSGPLRLRRQTLFQLARHSVNLERDPLGVTGLRSRLTRLLQSHRPNAHI